MKTTVREELDKIKEMEILSEKLFYAYNTFQVMSTDERGYTDMAGITEELKKLKLTMSDLETCAIILDGERRRRKDKLDKIEIEE